MLTYPNGHRHVIGEGVLENGTGIGFEPHGLGPGRYSFTIYALATKTPPMDPRFPASARTPDHILQSGDLVVR